jgi:DNA-binding protein HU-beta
MTKDELVTRIAAETNVTKKVAAALLEAFVKAIHGTLSQKDGTIRISDLGTFRVIQRKARTGVNPQTQKKIKIPAMNVPRFSPSKALRDAVKAAK